MSTFTSGRNFNSEPVADAFVFRKSGKQWERIDVTADVYVNDGQTFVDFIGESIPKEMKDHANTDARFQYAVCADANGKDDALILFGRFDFSCVSIDGKEILRMTLESSTTVDCLIVKNEEPKPRRDVQFFVIFDDEPHALVLVSPVPTLFQDACFSVLCHNPDLGLLITAAGVEKRPLKGAFSCDYTKGDTAIGSFVVKSQGQVYDNGQKVLYFVFRFKATRFANSLNEALVEENKVQLSIESPMPAPPKFWAAIEVATDDTIFQCSYSDGDIVHVTVTEAGAELTGNWDKADPKVVIAALHKSKAFFDAVSPSVAKAL